MNSKSGLVRFQNLGVGIIYFLILIFRLEILSYDKMAFVLFVIYVITGGKSNPPIYILKQLSF